MQNETRTHAAWIVTTLCAAVVMVCGMAGPAVAEALTVLPNEPLVSDLDRSEFSLHSSSSFSVPYDVSVSGKWNGVMLRWRDFEPQDLSSITQFVLGVKGTVDHIQIEFEDTNNNKTVIWSPLLTEEMQTWTIPASSIEHTDMSNILAIPFVVGHEHLGEGNGVGEFTVYVGGLLYHEGVDVDPMPSLEPATILPGQRRHYPLDCTTVSHRSTNEYVFLYDVTGEGVRHGLGFSWNSSWAGAYMASITQFVFNARGTADSIQVEFEDFDGVRHRYRLNGVSGDWQSWQVEPAPNQDLSRVMKIEFFVDEDLAGSGGPAGHLELDIHGWHRIKDGVVSRICAPATSHKPLTVLTNRILHFQSLNSTPFVGHSSESFTARHERKTEFSGHVWSGVALRRPDMLDIDLSGVDTYVVGVSGTLPSIGVEFGDLSGERIRFDLEGVTDTVQYWHIPSILLPVKTVSYINFVTHQFVPAGTSEEFTVHTGGWVPQLISPTAIAPSNPDVAPVSTPPQKFVEGVNDTVHARLSSSEHAFVYDVQDALSWNALLLTLGHYYSSEPPDMTDYTQLVFGVRGTSESVMLHFIDDERGETTFELTGVSQEWQHWHIDTALIENMDRIRSVLVVVAGDMMVNETPKGHVSLRFGSDGIDSPMKIDLMPASDDLPVTVLPDQPSLTRLMLSQFEQHSDEAFTVSYLSADTPMGGAGVMVHWPRFEPRDLSFVDPFVIGVTGTPRWVRLEFVDQAYEKTTIDLRGVSNTNQQWHIPAVFVPNLHAVRAVIVVVGWEHPDGQYTVNLGGLAYGADGWTDGVPNAWWNDHGIPEPDRVGIAHPTGHPSTHVENFVADTDPNNPTDAFTARTEINSATSESIVLYSGEPTSTSRWYDVWVADRLTGDTQAWTPLGLNVPGQTSRAAVPLVVTNDSPSRYFRTGVKIPPNP